MHMIIRWTVVIIFLYIYQNIIFYIFNTYNFIKIKLLFLGSILFVGGLLVNTPRVRVFPLGLDILCSL